jgi:hypothetical protein
MCVLIQLRSKQNKKQSKNKNKQTKNKQANKQNKQTKIQKHKNNPQKLSVEKSNFNTVVLFFRSSFFFICVQ